MIKAAVVGVGSMGRNHARVYWELPDVALVGVADTNEGALADMRNRFHVPVFADVQSLLEACAPDVVSVAVPTHAHASVVLSAIAAGCNVLVEKPIALTREEAGEMIWAAKAGGVVLAVGHIERYNPAVVELKKRLECGELGRVIYMHARRWGPYPRRIGDVGVALDLSTHDIDVMRYLTGTDVVGVYAASACKVCGQHEDLIAATLAFSDGSLGVVDTNWITPTKIRELVVIGERGMARVDYLPQDLYLYRNGLNDVKEADWEGLRLLRGVSEGEMVRVHVEREEPLRLELRAFIRATKGDRTGLAIASGEDGLAVLDVTLRALEASMPVTVTARL